MPLTGKWVCRHLSFFSTQINEWCCHVAGSNSISNFGIQNSTRIAAAGVNSIHNKKMTPSSFGKGRRKHHAHVCTQMSGMGCCWISPMAKEGAIGKTGDNQDGFTRFWVCGPQLHLLSTGILSWGIIPRYFGIYLESRIYRIIQSYQDNRIILIWLIWYDVQNEDLATIPSEGVVFNSPLRKHDSFRRFSATYLPEVAKEHGAP